MKFICFSNEYIINYYLNQLSLNYNYLNFKKINDIIIEIINNPFVTEKNKQQILKEYRLNIALKHFVDMCYHKTFYLSKPSANDTLLSLDKISNIDRDNLINLYIEKKNYIFHEIKFFLNIRNEMI